MYTSKNIIVAVATALIATQSTLAAPSARSTWPNMPASEIHSFSLEAWGPQETGGNGDAVFVDGNLASSSYISELKSKGKRVVCYISAGTVEDWRDDKSSFDDDTAKHYKGFGGTETWLDITQWESFKGPMEARINEAASKGCQFIEYDNVDCDANMCVSGASYDQLFKDQTDYLNWLISTTHGKGMGVGLKNAQSHIESMSSKIDFAINEECQKYDECYYYKQLSSQNKAAFGVEYDNNGGKVCSVAKEYHMLTKYRTGSTWHDC